jgi:ABC-type sugar transport system ATPase subunit
MYPERNKSEERTSDMASEKKEVLSIKNVSKSFYGSHALKKVSVDFYGGEVHIICGENGAGKSTLMKILSGMYMRDEGEIELFGKPFSVRSPAEAEKLGIVTIYQEFNLSPTISIAENIFLHREPGKLFVNRRKLLSEAQRYLDMIGCKIDPNTKVAHLSTANQQMVQIAKALSQNAKILIMDEPCSSITEEDTETLFRLINDLKQTGMSIIYIDHRVDNFKKIGERVTVLRDGAMIGTIDIDDISKEQIVKMMVGRDINSVYPKTTSPQDEIKFEVRNLSNQKLKDISFSVRKGEIFGLGGLVGAGRSEIVRAIFGIDPKDANCEILINNKSIKIKQPKHAIANGIVFVPEDRKIMGFVPARTINFNLVLPSIHEFGKGPFVDTRLEKQKADEQRESLSVRALSYNAHVRDLSGGNQQKVVIGKWLMRKDIEVFLMDEPTRGIDVGVKMEIYKLINTLASLGKSVILITSEMPELIGLCDRIATIAEGRLTRIFERNEFSQEKILEYCI